MAADKAPSQKTGKHWTGRHSGGLRALYSQVVVDRKLCKISTDMYVLSFINCTVFPICNNTNYVA